MGLTAKTTRTTLLLAVLHGCTAQRATVAREDAAPPQTVAPFELTATAPDVAAPLWVRAPIVLSFSTPIDPSSVGAGVRLEASSGPVAFTHQLDGAQLTLEISAPPLAPSPLSLSITSELRDLMGRAAQPATRSWQLPLWHSQPAEGVAARAPKLAHQGETTWLAWETGAAIQLAERTADGLQNIPPLPAEADALITDLLIDGQGRPVVAWRAVSAHIARFDASGWQALDGGLDQAIAPTQGLGPRLALGEQGTLTLAWPTSTGVELFGWSLAGPWQRLAPAATVAPLGVDLAWTPTGPLLGVLVDHAGNRDLQLLRLQAGAWQTLSEAAEHDRSHDVRELALDAAADGVALVAWTQWSDGMSKLYVARFDEPSQALQPLGPALNVALESDVNTPTLSAGDGSTPVVAFQEVSAIHAASYVARWNGVAFEVLGGSLGGRDAPALALGAHQQPIAATAHVQTGAIELHHYNESPAPPFGLVERKPQPCTLPPDSDPAFPKLLSQTRCYADVASQTVAEGFIPYDLNSPLWSDGAFKRRFFSIPDDTTIGFTDVDGWDVPVGTMLAKEFWLQRDPLDPASRFIVETRLMIKRCEPGSCRASWQGYSYQWTPAGDDATLLDNYSETVFVDWPVAGGVHTHSYPGRDECTRCHALSAGSALGLRTQQLNRNHPYSEHVDHQLRALFHAGLFGDTPPPADLYTLPRLPTPSDPSFDLNARVRGYFDANCSHCHSPTSRWPVVDLRFDAQLRADDGTGTTGNICNMLVPGDAEASILYVKQEARPGAIPEGFPGDTMPPIARLLPDEAQLPRLKAWIERMTTCP